MPAQRTYVTEPGYVIAAAMFLSALDIIAVILRFWTRTRQREALKADDWLILPATILVTAIAIETTYGVSQGAVAYPTEIPADFDGDPLEITTPQIALVYKIQWAFDLMLPLALGCIKASFLFFYLRIFVVNRKSLASYILGGLIVLVTLSSISFFFASLFQCRLNFWALWGSSLDIVNNCVETMHLVLAICIIGFITDVAIICAPIPLIWRLHLSTGKKLSIFAVFLLGSVTVVASMVRLINMSRLVAYGFSADEDGILVVTEYLYWGIVESGVGVFAACLPTLQFLLRNWSWKPLDRDAQGLISFRWPHSNPAVSQQTTNDSSGQHINSFGRRRADQKSSNSADSLSVGGTGTHQLEDLEAASTL